MKYTVLATLAVEVEADSHEQAVALVKAKSALIRKEMRWGASDGIVQYYEPSLEKIRLSNAKRRAT